MCGAESVCVSCEVMWVGQKECVFIVRFCGWVHYVCVLCELLWVVPNECVCSVRCCGWVPNCLCDLLVVVRGPEEVCV